MLIPHSYPGTCRGGSSGLPSGWLLRMLVMAALFVLASPGQAAVTVTSNGDSPPPPITVDSGEVVPFEASVNACGAGSSWYYYVWDFGDGTTTDSITATSPCNTDPTTSHTFNNPGPGPATYTVSFAYAKMTGLQALACLFGACPTSFHQQGDMDIRVRAAPPGGGGLTNFTIDHDGNGLTCESETITITARRVNGTPITSYTGTMVLTTSTTNGNWSVITGAGSLSETAGDDDGQASYQFDANDNGVVVLALRNTHAEALTITASAGTVNSTSTTLTFRAYGYRVEPDPVGTRVAGMPSSVTLTAVGNPPTDTGCTVIEEYSGNQTLAFWFEYVDPVANTYGSQLNVNGSPIGNGEGAATSLPVNFTNGVSDPAISLNYPDAGRIRFYARDDINIGDPPAAAGSEIIVGGGSFVVRPFGFDIDFSNDRATNGTGGVSYAADASGSVFTRAGVTFTASVRAVLWQGTDDSNNDGIPDTGAWLADNNVTPNFGNESSPVVPADLALTNTLVAPAGGDNGTLAVPNRDAAFNAGSANMELSWDEAGITDITASYTDYLGGGQNITGTVINVGRFTPHHFSVTATEACNSSFTYSAQPFTVTVDALNLGGNPTRNYDGAFVQDPVISNAGDTSGFTNNTLDSSYFTTADGIGIRNDVTYTFANRETAPLAITALRATDSDGITSETYMEGQLAIRSGRIALDNAYGSELVDLQVPMIAQYYDGNTFITNSLDVCADGITISLLNPTDTVTVGDGSARGQTCVQDTGSPGNSGAGCTIAGPASERYTDIPAAGEYTLYLKAPDSDATFDPNTPIYGHVTVQANAPGYLQYDWDGDTSEENPDATATFGRYRGDDRIIYWEEKFQ